MTGSITVTYVIGNYDGERQTLPGLRIRVGHIVAYMPHSEGGAVIQTSDHESYRVAENVDQIDLMIAREE